MNQEEEKETQQLENIPIDVQTKFDIKLRENFLNFLKCSQQQKVKIRFLECPMELDCKIEAYEPSSLKYLAVSNLQTPIGMQKHAILRSEDIVWIKFPGEK